MSPAAVAERELEYKKRNPAAVSEPGAFDRYAGGRHEHWCAHFTSWLHAQAGQPLPQWMAPSPSYFPRHAGCTWLWNLLSGLGLVHKGTPKRDDLIFYKHSSSKYASGHIGIVTGVENGKVVSIEGNLTPGGGRPDTIARCKHSLSSSKILGYGRVYKAQIPIGNALVIMGGAAAAFAMLKNRNKK